MSLIVPLEAIRRETQAGNSRFIASLVPVDEAPAARAAIEAIRHEFPDASHHVPAYILGGGNSVQEYCSDDGEPSGTSGRPLLAVLKGSGLGNCLIVVSRYFGGTKLGTGGLVKAYSAAGQAVLADCRRARLQPVHQLELELDYAWYEAAKLELLGRGGRVLSEDFQEKVGLRIELDTEAWPVYQQRLADLSAGQAVFRLLATSLSRLPL